MKVSVEDRQGLFKSLKVEVEGDIVRSALDEVYNYLKENAEVEGFRRGKTPLWIIKAKFKDYIKEEVGKKGSKRHTCQCNTRKRLKTGGRHIP